jgi:hypothetical protein
MVVANSLGPFVALFLMVVALGFIPSSPSTKSPSLVIDDMDLLVGVPFLPFGDDHHHIIL